MTSICPFCRQSDAIDNQLRMKKMAEASLHHGMCTRCHIGVITIEFGQDSLSTMIGMATDLTKKDITRMWNGSRITEDDMIELHTMFRQTSVTKLIKNL